MRIAHLYNSAFDVYHVYQQVGKNHWELLSVIKYDDNGKLRLCRHGSHKIFTYTEDELWFSNQLRVWIIIQNK